MNVDVKRVFLVILLAVIFSACGGEDTVSVTKENDSNTNNAQSTKYSGTQDDPILIESGKRYPLNSNKAYNNFKIPKGKDLQTYGAVSPSLSTIDRGRCSYRGYDIDEAFCTQGWKYSNSWNDDEGNRCVNIQTFGDRKGYIEFVLIKAKEEDKQQKLKKQKEILEEWQKQEELKRQQQEELKQQQQQEELKRQQQQEELKQQEQQEDEEKLKLAQKKMVNQLLTKIGSYKEKLESTSSYWDAVEVNERYLMIENKTYASSLIKYSHQDAVEYCNDLEKAGYSDWRLSTKSEITTIFNALNYGTYGLGREYLKNFFESSIPYTWLSDYYSNYYYAYQSRSDNRLHIDHSSSSSKPVWCIRKVLTKEEKLKKQEEEELKKKLEKEEELKQQQEEELKKKLQEDKEKFIGLWKGDVIQAKVDNTPIVIEITDLDYGEISGTVKYPENGSKGNLILESSDDGEYIFREKLTRQPYGQINNGLFNIKKVDGKLVWRWWHETKSIISHGVMEKLN